ncbi:MAG: FkbM family methyltransferase [Terrimicrobiaceae bacterium]
MKKNLIVILQRIFETFLRFYLIERVADVLLKVCLNRNMSVRHGNIDLRFSIPNLLNKSRAATFSSKEPETLRWIDSLSRRSTFWDIGANVGLYSCYAAKARDCRVYAFEPSVFNLEILARNVNLNGLSDQVTLFPLPLCRKMEVQSLNMTSMEWGGALSTFGEDFGHDGKRMNKIFSFQTLGVSMDDAASNLAIPLPDYVKMDVDGLEHLILQGGIDVLNHVKGILIEINDGFLEQAEVSAASLKQAGFRLVEKAHSELVHNSAFSSAFNQIWEK